MAEFQKKRHKDSRSKTTCFLGCFGFSGEEVADKMARTREEVGSGSRKMSRWFSWSKFRMKRPPTKTVPVDAPEVSDKSTHYSIEARTPKAKSDKLTTSKRRNLDTGRKPQSQLPARKSDQDIREKPQQTKYGPERTTVMEDRSRNFDSAKDDTCQELMTPVSRKLHYEKTGRSHSGSLETKFTSVNPHSASFPILKTREKPRGNTSVHHSESETSSKTVGKFDTVVGMSIITVTLIIMILWGRLCAILCTSAWLYFIPRLRSTAVIIKSDGVLKNRLNSSRGIMDSEEYKKKVVLEGFLQRNHRSNIGCTG